MASFRQQKDWVLYPLNFWDRSERRVGSTLTNILKFGAGVAIVAAVAVVPVAAALVPLRGTLEGSCINIRQEEFRSTDRNIQGSFRSVTAQCRFDRADHGLKSNQVIIATGDTCQYLHNNNGTVVATDSPVYFPGSGIKSSGYDCPPLEGSFKKTCGSNIQSQPYMSSDYRIPYGTVCEYTIRDCKKIGSGTVPINKLYLSRASVTCLGDKVENCKGKLEVRTGGASDKQCETQKDEL